MDFFGESPRCSITPMRIDIVSDMICPWCYLGKRRLEVALARHPELSAKVNWLPFELNPSMPAGGMPRDEYLGAKFGSLDTLREAESRLAGLGDQEGITYRFDRIRMSPNTRAAHALAEIAAETGQQDTIVEALFRAYFESGKDIGNLDTLLVIAASAGLEPSLVRARIAAREDWPAIEAAEQEIRSAGITGVPFFILDRRLVLQGAQEPAAFEGAFDELARTRGNTA